jgi:hypothetical protein
MAAAGTVYASGTPVPAAVSQQHHAGDQAPRQVGVSQGQGQPDRGDRFSGRVQVPADVQPRRGQHQPGDAEQDRAPAKRPDPGPVGDREHRRGDHHQHDARRQQQPGGRSGGHLGPPG